MGSCVEVARSISIQGGTHWTHGPRESISMEDFAAQTHGGDLDGIQSRLSALRDSCTWRMLQRFLKDPTCAIEITTLLAHLWELLHSSYWKDVPCIYREFYALASCASALRLLGLQRDLEALRAADMGILLGSPCVARSKLQDIAQRIHDAQIAGAQVVGAVGAVSQHNTDDDGEGNRLIGKRQRLREPPAPTRLPPHSLSASTALRRLHRCSLSDFSSLYFDIGMPVIIGGMMDEWPAMGAWSDLGQIKRLMGLRTVPVEIGRTYLDYGAGTRLMTVSAFIDAYILGGGNGGGDGETGYLAQHRLLDHIPALMHDIDVPDYTVLGESRDNVSINCWFGPANTISPLHFDTSHNILAQISGHKYVRLYAPNETPKLYPLTGKMKNNSRVDLLNVDTAAFPAVSSAQFVDAILSPGEMLYIPKGHWHFVQAYTNPPHMVSEFSFSVSFWWDCSELEMGHGEEDEADKDEDEERPYL